MLALLAVMGVVIGVVSVVALNRFLMHRLDQQVVAAALRSNDVAANPPTGGGARPGNDDGDDDHGFHYPPFLANALGLGIGTIGAQVSGGTAEAGIVGSNGHIQPISGTASEGLVDVPVDGRPHTRDLGAGLDEYRVVASRTKDGTTVITGLPLNDALDTVYRLAAVITMVTLLGLVLAAFLGLAIVRLTLRPLRRVTATARRVAELPLDRGEVALAVRVPAADSDPRTEVGQVGAALNRMLDHVGAALTARQASETRVRHFVADASHELRTPLAAIRGYAELTRPRRKELPPDVTHALDRVESESVRMTGLVEDLLLLARLDSGRPLERQPVDLSRMLVEAVSDARVVAPDHRWQLQVPEDSIEVTGDLQRLHQVVTNLLTNARKYTPAGTTVTVTARPDGFSVHDDGPGFPPGLADHAFERFARGDASRTRGEQGGVGLGLALVKAIVTAHGGRVALRSRPGSTEVTVTLPR
jgi:two-component system OmpR family sensor kinase